MDSLTATIGGAQYRVELERVIDASIHMFPHAVPEEQINAFGLPAASASPVRGGGFVGDVRAGGSVNCETLSVCAHGSGTHTECAGHVTHERLSVMSVLSNPGTHSLRPATLVTVESDTLGASGDSYAFTGALPEDPVVSSRRLREALARVSPPAGFQSMLILRTASVGDAKPRVWEKWPYITEEALQCILSRHVEHLVVDTPSVDRWDDGGVLRTHTAFLGVAQCEKERRPCYALHAICAPGHFPCRALLIESSIPVYFFLCYDVTDPHQIKDGAMQRLAQRPVASKSITELASIDVSVAPDGVYVGSLHVAPIHMDAAPSRLVLWPVQAEPSEAS